MAVGAPQVMTPMGKAHWDPEAHPERAEPSSQFSLLNPCLARVLLENSEYQVTMVALYEASPRVGLRE
jgi:hypothetical protein